MYVCTSIIEGSMKRLLIVLVLFAGCADWRGSDMSASVNPQLRLDSTATFSHGVADSVGSSGILGR